MLVLTHRFDASILVSSMLSTMLGPLHILLKSLKKTTNHSLFYSLAAIFLPLHTQGDATTKSQLQMQTFEFSTPSSQPPPGATKR